MSQKSFGAFINDDWKASARLTLSLGLRYELFTPTSEQNNLATNFFPDRGLVQLGTGGLDQLYKADKNNFGPRAGLAWDPTGDGKTSVRAGYALTYDNTPIGVVHPGLFSTPALGVFRVSFSQQPPSSPTARRRSVSTRTTPRPAATTSASSRACPCSARRPPACHRSTSSRCPTTSISGYYHYFHATFQRELFHNNSVTVSYVGSRGKDLVWRTETNAAPLGSPTTGNTDSFRPFFKHSRSIAASSSSPTTASRGTTACSCPTGRTCGTA